MTVSYFYWCRTCDKKISTPYYHKKKRHDVIKVRNETYK